MAHSPRGPAPILPPYVVPQRIGVPRTRARAGPWQYVRYIRLVSCKEFRSPFVYVLLMLMLSSLQHSRCLLFTKVASVSVSPASISFANLCIDSSLLLEVCITSPLAYPPCLHRKWQEAESLYGELSFRAGACSVNRFLLSTFLLAVCDIY
jgi:hypothetical protein